MSFREVLLERLGLSFPDVDLGDPRVRRELIDPLVQYVGDEFPRTSAEALIRARLADQFPDLDGTVFGDLFGKAADLLISTLLAELSALRSRRRQDEEALLTGTDLADQFSAFLVDPSEGQLARGSMRVFYRTPRAVSLDVTNQIEVPGRGSSRSLIFVPTFPQSWSSAEVRDNRQGNLYYVDVDMIAAEAGEEYSLDAGQAQGAQGFPGSTSVTNLRPFSEGSSRDNAQRLRQRIRTALTSRGLATLAGLEYVLPQLGITDFQLVRGGDHRMVRDRIYGPASISGIPGGFSSDLQNVQEGAFVSLGVAYDIWCKEEARLTRPVRLENISREGVEVLVARGSAIALTLTTVRVASNGPVFQETVGYPADSQPVGLLRPVVVGDLLTIDRIFVPGTNRLARFEITFVAASVVEAELTDPEVTLAVGTAVGGGFFRVSRGLTLYSGLDGFIPAVPSLEVSLSDQIARSAGQILRVSGARALPKPGTEIPDSRAGAPVPRTENVIREIDLLPIRVVERVEVVDALSGAPTGVYAYPRLPLYAEFLDSRPRPAADKAVRLRVHLLGPQMFALGTCEVTERPLPSESSSRLTPMYWRFANASTSPEGAGATTDRVVVDNGLGDALGTQEHADLFFRPSPVEGRFIRPGDVAVAVVPGSFQSTYVLPIAEVGADYLRLAAPDLPVGALGVSVWVLQGASRESLLSEGRGPEGTYSVDIWLAEQAQLPAGYSPAPPPLSGTKAFIPPSGILDQGFDLVSPLPGQEFSPRERTSLLLSTGYLGDRTLMQGGSLILHAIPSERSKALQQRLDLRSSEGVSPLVASGLAKAYAPAFVVGAFYYDALNLPAASAARSVADEIERASEQGRLELSDLTDALYRAGADFVLDSRIFVARMNHLRQWEYFGTRDAIPSLDVGTFLAQAITCVRLRRRARGETLNHLDPENWAEDPAVLRSGGFDAD